MSIPVPPSLKESLHWCLQDDPQGEWLFSHQCSWKQISLPVEIDPGFVVYESVKAMKMLLLGITGSDMVYQLPVSEPVHYFSFDRYATRFGSGSSDEDYNALNLLQSTQEVWLYSVYGYTLEHSVIAFKYQPSREIEFLVLPRPVQFPW